MAFSVFLEELEPKLSRQELEEISKMIPSVGKVDCAYIHDDWFGIVASGLELSDAAEFQKELRVRGCESLLVEDSEIPALHDDFRCQRIDLKGEEIILSSSMGRRYPRKKGDLVFISAGMIERESLVTKSELRNEYKSSRELPYLNLKMVDVKRSENKSYFRVDLFFSSDPYRISLEIDEESVMFYGDRPIGMKSSLERTVLLVDLQNLLPPERLNQGLREISEEILYPTMHAYEEELRWSFYRLGARG